MFGSHDTPARVTPRNRRQPRAEKYAVATSYASTPAAAIMPPVTRSASRNTPRILGRYTTTQQIPHSFTSSQSDLEIEGDDAFHSPPVRQKRTILTLGRSPMHPAVASMDDDDDAREYNSAAIIRGFIDNKHPGSQDIALLTILRCWHVMAVDCRKRCERLRVAWVTSIKVHRTNLLKEVFFKWKREATGRFALPSSDYQRVQLRLATLSRRNLLLRMVTSRLVQHRETMRRLEIFQQSTRFNLASSCLTIWKDQWQQRRQATHLRLERQFKRESKVRLLAQTLRRWLTFVHAEEFARYFESKNQIALVTHCLHIWHEQCVSREHGGRSRRGTVDDGNRSKKSILRSESEVSADPQVHNIFVRWRAAARELKIAQYRAEVLSYHKSWGVTLEKLQDAYYRRLDMEDVADIHYKTKIVGQIISRLCTLQHERRDQLLQLRAAQDIARIRDQKRRRVLLRAWREVAEKGHSADIEASDIISNRQTTGFRAPIRSPEAGRGYNSKIRHISGHAYGPHASPLRYSEQESPAGRRTHAHRNIQADLAIGDRCDRAISVQSDNSILGGSEEKLELIRRAREAETMVDRYKREWIDPHKVKLELIDLDVDLERRLTLWTEYQAKLVFRNVLSRLQRAIAGPQSGKHSVALRGHRRNINNNQILEDEDEDTQELLFAKNYPDVIIDAKFRARRSVMKSVLFGFQAAVRARANVNALADEFYYNRRSPANQRLCKRVVNIWYHSLCDRRDMVKAAEAHYLKSIFCKFQYLMTEKQLAYLQLNDVAVSFDRQCTLLSVLRVFLGLSFESTRDHSDRIYERHYGGESDLDQGLIVDVTVDGQDDVTDVSKLVHLREILCVWRKTVSDFQEAKYKTMTCILPRMRPDMAKDDQGLGKFSWELMHKTFLVSQSFNRWRQLVNRKPQTRHSQAVPAIAHKLKNDETRTDMDVSVITENIPVSIDDDALDGDGPNASVLHELEAQMATRVKSKMCRTMLHRLMVLTRGKLLEQKRLARSVNKLMTTISERAKAAKVARDKARDFAARSSIRAWQNIHIRNCQNLENAQTQADGTLVLTCFQRWRNALKKRRSHKCHRKMYTTAIALRWKHQAQDSLLQWMRASTNERVMVRLAERSGAQREAILIKAADRWNNKRLAKNTLKELDSLAFQRQSARRLDMCFAVAWSDTNIQRKSLLKWRNQISPSSSMFFSGSYCE